VNYREPSAKGFIRKSEFAAGETVIPQSFPGIKIPVGEIFG
jgi:hypothetical protein